LVFTRVPDRPGSLARLARARRRGGRQPRGVEHLREGLDLHVRETAVQLVLETRGASTPTTCSPQVRGAGYEARVVR